MLIISPRDAHLASSANPLAMGAPVKKSIQFKKPQIRFRNKTAATKGPSQTDTNHIQAFFKNNTRYEFLGMAGCGGMGHVYKAKDKILNLPVALKFLPPHLVRNPEALEAFKNEARVVMQLSHQNIVKLHNLEISSAGLFLVMEYVDGKDFAQILKEMGRLSVTSTIQIARSCAKALDYAHSRSVLHKDLKPANLMLDHESCLKIVDFGIAGKFTEADAGAEEFLAGTIPYISPEQIQGLPLDPRTDVYSFGAVLYEFLAGRPLFPFESSLEDVLQMEPQPIEGIDEALLSVLQYALAKNPTDRWNTCGEFYQALVQVTSQ